MPGQREPHRGARPSDPYPAGDPTLSVGIGPSGGTASSEEAIMASNRHAPGRLQPGANGALAGAGAFATFALEDDADRRKLRWAIAIAALLHLALLTVPVLRISQAQGVDAPKPKVYVLKRFVFLPPPPPDRVPVRAPVRRVPIPAADPDRIEPLRQVGPVEPEIDVSGVDVVTGIPEAPPAVEPEGPRPVGGDVSAPEKLYAPQPEYTHAALIARIEGPVVVQATIDEQGRVVAVKVLQGQPMGLTEAAVDKVRQWRFRPATVRGRPVSVYYNLTVTFRLH
jgi:TonB family protein